MFTLLTQVINFGSLVLTQLYLFAQSIDIVADQITLLSAGVRLGLSSARYLHYIFTNSGQIVQTFFADELNLGVATAEMRIDKSTITPTSVLSGTISFLSSFLKTPNTVLSNDTSLQVNLYTTQSDKITIGSNAALSVPNIVENNSPATVASLFGNSSGSLSVGSTNTLGCNVFGLEYNVNTDKCQIIGKTRDQSFSSDLTIDDIITQTYKTDNGNAVSTATLTATSNNSAVANDGDFAIQSRNIILKGTNSSLTKKTTLDSTSSEQFFCDAIRPTVATATVQVLTNDSATTNDGVYVLQSRSFSLNNNLFSITGKNTINHKDHVINNTNSVETYYCDTAVLRAGVKTATVTVNDLSSATDNKGSYQIDCRDLVLNCGVKMSNTNVSGIAWKICYGQVTTTPAVGAGGYSASISQSFGATFGNTPQVFAIVQKNSNNSWAAVAAYFHCGIDAVNTTSFNWSVRNTAGGTGALANSYWINWYAIGSI